MIRSFANKATRVVFDEEQPKGMSRPLAQAALRKLLLIHGAHALDDLKIPPGNRLEPLRGKRTGQHSIRVNDQWRICFRWVDGDAYEVELVDYH